MRFHMPSGKNSIYIALGLTMAHEDDESQPLEMDLSQLNLLLNL
jgi:hypothetical protein